MPTVPDLYGMTVAEAESAWTSAGFSGSVSSIPYAKSNTLDVGDVRTQDKVPGTVLAATSGIGVLTVTGPYPDPPTLVNIPIIMTLFGPSGETLVNGFTRWNAIAAFLDFDLDFEEEWMYVRAYGLAPIVPAGSVVYTSPPPTQAGVYVNTGTVVKLGLSLGIYPGPKTVMPDIRGLENSGSLDYKGQSVITAPAALALDRAGVPGTRYGFGKSDTLNLPAIKAQVPAPNYVFADGETKGAWFALANFPYVPTNEQTARNVVGNNVWWATLLLSVNPQHWEVVVNRAYHPTAPIDSVISQSPTPEDGPQPEGSAITLLVSDGPDTTVVEVPDVVGEDEATAVSAIEAVELAAAVRVVYSELVTVGLVAMTDPPAGVFIPRGGTVMIFVSRGPAPALLDWILAYKSSGNKEGDCLGGTQTLSPFYSYWPEVISNTLPAARVVGIGYAAAVRQFAVKTLPDESGAVESIYLETTLLTGEVRQGDPVEVAALVDAPFAVLAAYDHVYWVHLALDSAYPLTAGELVFRPVLLLDGPVGHGPSEQAERETGDGVTRYSCLFLMPTTRCYLTSIEFAGGLVSGVWAEAIGPFGETVAQVVPDEFTEPEGADWLTEDTHGLDLELGPFEVVAFWIRTTHGPDAPIGLSENVLRLTVGIGNDLESAAFGEFLLAGGCWLSDETLRCFRLYRSIEDETAGGELMAEFTALPASIPITLPEAEELRRFRVTEVNEYGLESLNTHLEHALTITPEGGGIVAPDPPTAELVDAGGGMLEIRAKWFRGIGGEATSWRFTVTSNGEEDEAVIETAFTANTPTQEAVEFAGPYGWGVTAFVTVEAVADGVSGGWQGALRLTSETPPARAPQLVNDHLRQPTGFGDAGFVDLAGGWSAAAIDGAISFVDEEGGIRLAIFTANGLWGIFGDTDGDETIPLDSAPSAQSWLDEGAGRLWLVAGGVSVAYFDLSDGTLYTTGQLALMEEECPMPGPLVWTPNKLHMQVPEPGGRWRNVLTFTAFGAVEINPIIYPE